MPKDDITGREIPLSNKSTHVIWMALAATYRAGVISENDYRFTYAEVVEPGRAPQVLGGEIIPAEDLERWKTATSWEEI